MVFSNPSFEDRLLHPELYAKGGDFSILLEWLAPFLATQSEQGKVQVSSKILYFCFDVFQHPRFPEVARSFCLGEGMRLLRRVMEDTETDNEFADRDVALALKLDIVALVDKYVALIQRTAQAGDPRASKVLGLRLSLDCRLLEMEFKEVIKPDLYRGRIIPQVHPSELWNLIESTTWSDDDTSLLQPILSALTYTPTLDLLDSKNFDQKDQDRVKRYSKSVFDIQRLLVVLFNKISDLRPRNMRVILEDEGVCSAAIGHLLNAKRQTLESTCLDMLKTAYDVPGKTDLWRQLLRVSFAPSLHAVCNVTRQIMSMQRIFPPDKLRPWHRGYLLAYVGKIIRQSMQIVDILCAGRNGILTTTDILSQSDSNTEALQLFWRTFWDVLNVAFISATSWAEAEDKDVMKHFLRDVLEAASVLFDALKTIDASLSGERVEQPSPIKASSTQHSLLKVVQTPLQSISKWLALNVEELRETTLVLASRILKRFARAEVQVREDTLVQYDQLARGKKRNNMSEEQRERLLFVLSEHDVQPGTRKPVEAMAATREMGRVTPPVAQGQAWTTPEMAKVKFSRDVIDLSAENEYLTDYLSDSELSSFMDRLEKKTPTQTLLIQKSNLKQTKLDFRKGVLKPPSSTGMVRTTSLPSKPVTAPKPPTTGKPSELAQLRADFNDRQKALLGAKPRRAPVAPPPTDAFGRPLDAAGRVIEAPKPPAKKVEESSSSESESDDDAGGLFSIAKENRSPPKIRKVEKRKVQLLGGEGPVRSRLALQARERELGRVPSERNIRARITPDLTPLLKRVLSWTPGHTGTFPPGIKQSDFKRVAATYPSPNKYEETFQPLLMLECWQHILHAKMEQTIDSFDVIIENRQKVDDYVEIFVTMKTTAYANVTLLDPDLLILSNRQGSGGKECFAKVQGVKKKQDSVELRFRCMPSADMAALLVPKATMFGVKLFRYILPQRG